MPFESAQLCAGRDIPQLDRVVRTPARESLPIETECDSADTFRMPFESAQLCAGRDIPELDSFIRTAAGKSLPIGTECD